MPNLNTMIRWVVVVSESNCLDTWYVDRHVEVIDWEYEVMSGGVGQSVCCWWLEVDEDWTGGTFQVGDEVCFGGRLLDPFASICWMTPHDLLFTNLKFVLSHRLFEFHLFHRSSSSVFHLDTLFSLTYIHTHTHWSYTLFPLYQLDIDTLGGVGCYITHLDGL